MFALCILSCESYFDVPLQDQPTLEEMFSKKTTARNLAAHMYSYLPKDESVTSTTDEGGFIGRTDVRQINASAYANNVYDMRVGDYGPSTLTAFSLWEKYYKAIAHCTLVIENIWRDKEDNDDVRNYIKNEARFMRAFYYFCLFRTYGPVIVWGDQAAPSDVQGATLDRNTFDENIDFIVEQLDTCIKYLPKSITDVGLQEKSEMGRATKGAAMALKSRVLLYAASPLYNGGHPGYVSMTNRNGEYIFPQEKDPAKWEDAKKAAKDLIDLNLYKLVKVPSTGNAFSDAVRSYQNVFFEPWNEETIWGWWMNYYTDHLGRTGGFIAASAPRGLGLEGWQSITPSFKLVDAYAMYDTGRYPVTGYDRSSDMDDYSLPIIDEESGYVHEGFTRIRQQIDADWAPEFEAHNSTIGREPRYYACLVPNGYYWPCNPKYKTAKNSKTGLNTWTEKDMQVLFYRNSGALCERWDTDNQNNYFGYAWRRLYKADNPLDESKNYNTVNYVFPEFRLAEIYFNYAECCIETGDYAEAVTYIDMIRERAGLCGLEKAYPGITGNPELLRWCFRQEKMIEFALEGPMHFYDDTRWMIAEETFPSLNWTLNLNDAEDYYDSWTRSSEDFPLAKHAKFTKRDYLLPFSVTQLAEMPNITQNYGF